MRDKSTSEADAKEAERLKEEAAQEARERAAAEAEEARLVAEVGRWCTPYSLNTCLHFWVDCATVLIMSIFCVTGNRAFTLYYKVASIAWKMIARGTKRRVDQ